MKDRRSENFNYFSDKDRQKNKKASVFKRVWFWIKIVIYVLIFGFTLTGCIQSFVISSSNYTGNGIEFYTSHNRVSPHVTTFKQQNDFSNESVEPEKNDPVFNYAKDFVKSGEFLGLVEDQTVNYHLSYENSKDILEKLREQTEQAKGKYGSYLNYNTAVRFVDLNNKAVNNTELYLNNGKYLFATIGIDPERQKESGVLSDFENYKYRSIFSKYNSWEFIDPSFNFNEYFKTDNNGQTFVLRLNPNNASLLAGTYNEKDLQKGHFIENVKISNQGNKSEVRLDFEKELSTFVIENSSTYKDPNTSEVIQDPYGIGALRRDYLEALALNTFDVEATNTNNFYSRVLRTTNYSSYGEWSKKLVEQIKNNPGDVSLSGEQFLAIRSYTLNISKYANILNFSSTNRVNAQREVDLLALKKTVEKFNNSSDEKEKESLEAQIKALNEKLTSVDSISVDAPNSKYTLNTAKSFIEMPFQGEMPQRIIDSWATSWKLGPFYGLFVYPLAYVSSWLTVGITPLSGWGTILAILIITIILRGLMLAVTWKQTINQSKQEELKSKKAKIDAKYIDFKDNKQMKARHQQEISELYKKNGINPLDTFATLIISLPFFFAIWRVIQGLPEMKSTTFLSISFSQTSWRRLFFEQEWQYLGILIVVGIVQGISQFLPKLLNMKKFKERTTPEEAKALKKSNRTQTIMSVVFFFITFIFAAGVQVYWIISGLWTIGQTLAIHYYKKSARYRRKYLNKN
ncbi:Oxa1Ec [Mycoplasmopsis maculosa]|uniref:Oxa1Ec n=1 Tax=Mycoplasmopsis maculosa TaxID=114885 RepID=A0A449B4U8_9BACT|nr:membrane protein insertase YidC [Mycoplasmopsis maculosa]VEU75634.1 Oxa1Ec [Mycoplasmopsis maculosa]